jgi:hypothetical protein
MKKYMLNRNITTEALEQALARIDRGELPDECLAHLPDPSGELRGLIEARLQLKALAPAPPLSAEVLAAQRRRFLAQAGEYKPHETEKQQPLTQRWLQRIGQSHPRLRTALVAGLLAVCLVAGLVHTAQASTPTSPLYQIKIGIEDVQLGLAWSPAQHASLALAFAAERVREIELISSQGQPVPQAVLVRLEDQLNAALRDAAGTEGTQQQHILAEVNAITTQLQHALMQASTQAPMPTQVGLREAERLLEQTRLQAETRLNAPSLPSPTPMAPSATPMPTLTQQARPSPSATPRPSATRQAQPSATPHAPSRTPQQTQMPVQNRADWQGEVTHTPMPQATSMPPAPSQTRQPQQTAQPATQPTTAPAHPQQPGPAKEDSTPKRTSFNPPVMPVG